MRVSSITFLRASGGVNSHSFGCPEAATKSRKSFAFVHSCIANSFEDLAPPSPQCRAGRPLQNIATADPSRRLLSDPLFRQLLQQLLRLLQIARIEPLGEPAVHRSQQFARLLNLALVAPEASEA